MLPKVFGTQALPSLENPVQATAVEMGRSHSPTQCFPNCDDVR
jgi:hypothetical protein